MNKLQVTKATEERHLDLKVPRQMEVRDFPSNPNRVGTMSCLSPRTPYQNFQNIRVFIAEGHGSFQKFST
jgi:hypothetical protein